MLIGVRSRVSVCVRECDIATNMRRQRDRNILPFLPLELRQRIVAIFDGTLITDRRIQKAFRTIVSFTNGIVVFFRWGGAGPWKKGRLIVYGSRDDDWVIRVNRRHIVFLPQPDDVDFSLRISKTFSNS